MHNGYSPDRYRREGQTDNLCRCVDIIGQCERVVELAIDKLHREHVRITRRAGPRYNCSPSAGKIVGDVERDGSDKGREEDDRTRAGA